MSSEEYYFTFVSTVTASTEAKSVSSDITVSEFMAKAWSFYESFQSRYNEDLPYTITEEDFKKMYCAYVNGQCAYFDDSHGNQKLKDMVLSVWPDMTSGFFYIGNVVISKISFMLTNKPAENVF